MRFRKQEEPSETPAYDRLVEYNPEPSPVPPKVDSLGDIRDRLKEMIDAGANPGAIDWVLKSQFEWPQGDIEPGYRAVMRAQTDTRVNPAMRDRVAQAINPRPANPHEAQLAGAMAEAAIAALRDFQRAEGTDV